MSLTKLSETFCTLKFGFPREKKKEEKGKKGGRDSKNCVETLLLLDQNVC